MNPNRTELKSWVRVFEPNETKILNLVKVWVSQISTPIKTENTPSRWH